MDLNMINDCFKISENITHLYKELNKCVMNHGKDSDEYRERIIAIKKLIIKEESCYNELKHEEILNGFNQIEKIPLEELKEFHTRIVNKLSNAFEMLFFNRFITKKILPIGLDDFSVMESGMPDIMYSMYELEVAHKIEEKINSVIEAGKMNIDFVSELLDIHNEYMISYLTMRRTSEIVMLNCDFDFSKVAPINYSSIRENMANYENTSLYREDDLNNVIMDNIVEVLNNLFKLGLNWADAKTYYQYMYYLSVFELYISYLDVKQLNCVLDIINNMNDKDIKQELYNILARKKKNN